MSIAVMTNVWEHSPSTGNELVVLLALADSADDEGKCWPGVQRLAAKARVHRATVFRLLGCLRDSGEIIVERRPGQASVYRLAKYAVQAPVTTAPSGSRDATRRTLRPVAKHDPSQSATRRTGATIEPSVNNLVNQPLSVPVGTSTPSGSRQETRTTLPAGKAAGQQKDKARTPREPKPLWDAFCAAWHLPPSGGRHKSLAGEFDRDCVAAGATADEFRQYVAMSLADGSWGEYVQVHNTRSRFLAWRDRRHSDAVVRF